ncbi:hypothetical protein ACF061_02620 [Streptomyces sp. NPDC015220]|uniref:hypothetical protein n=1 Tax=Streptomyces sp. NPDC015220 TaxID=3364947 RepID=UPI0036F9239B
MAEATPGRTPESATDEQVPPARQAAAREAAAVGREAVRGRKAAAGVTDTGTGAGTRPFPGTHPETGADPHSKTGADPYPETGADPYPETGADPRRDNGAGREAVADQDAGPDGRRTAGPGVVPLGEAAAADTKGAPAPGSTGFPASAGARTSGSASATTAADGDGTGVSSLLPRDECDDFGARLREAVTGFVDGPRGAVEEADRVVEELAGRFTEAVTRRRHALRSSWQSDGDGERGGDTERLRLALRDYRELADRLTRL